MPQVEEVVTTEVASAFTYTCVIGTDPVFVTVKDKLFESPGSTEPKDDPSAPAMFAAE